MKGIATYVHKDKSFSIWQARLRDELPSSDQRLGDPVLWWSKCNVCRDLVVCGLPTKGECLELTNKHFSECQTGTQR